VILLPASTFLKLDAIETARMVGLPVEGSQSAKYSINPKGAPPTEAGLFSRVDDESGFGKTVESVPSFSSRSIRRAIAADSRTVGILKPSVASTGGLEKTC